MFSRSKDIILWFLGVDNLWVPLTENVVLKSAECTKENADKGRVCYWYKVYQMILLILFSLVLNLIFLYFSLCFALLLEYQGFVVVNSERL